MSNTCTWYSYCNICMYEYVENVHVSVPLIYRAEQLIVATAMSMERTSQMSDRSCGRQRLIPCVLCAAQWQLY